jgi:hypothetical protein
MKLAVFATLVAGAAAFTTSPVPTAVSDGIKFRRYDSFIVLLSPCFRI